MRSSLFTFDIVHKTVAIFLVSIYLMSSTSLVELIKIPELMEHYSNHRSESNDISFLDFMHQHYSDEHTSDDAGHKHCGLPFKTHEQGSVFYQFTFINEFEILLNSFCEAQNVHMNPSDSILLSNYLSSIWQPPQLG